MENKREYNMKLNDVIGWEVLDGGKVSILRVPGGWIYTTLTKFKGVPLTPSSVFVPLHKVNKERN